MLMALMVMVMVVMVRKEIKYETKNGDGDGDPETTNYNLNQIYRSVFTPLFSIRYTLNPSFRHCSKVLERSKMNLDAHKTSVITIFKNLDTK